MVAPWLVGACLASGDVVAFGVSAWAIQYVRGLLLGPMPHSETLWGVAVAWLALRLYAGLYPGYGLSGPEELRRTTWTTGVAGLGHAALIFASQEAVVSRFLALGTWAVLLAVNWIVRTSTRALLIGLDLYSCPVVIAGAAATGALAIRELRANRTLGFVPVALFDDDPAKHGTYVQGVPVMGSVEDALRVRFPYRICHAIVAMPGAPSRRLVEIAEAYGGRFENVGIVPDLFGVGNMWVSPRCLGTVMTLEIRNNLLRAGNRRIKRALDIAVGSVLFVLSFPVVVLAGLVVKLVSPGPVLYRQEREGLFGRRIQVLKIRTMVPDAERVLADHLAADAEARAHWERHMKLERDPRVVPVVGRLLRRYSADELPQFLNVLRGEMSLVGPRPFPDYHLGRFAARFRELRRQVPAGITGLWQVTSRSMGDLQVQEAADSYYIRNWSPWLDLWLLLRTVAAVLTGRGAC